MVRAASVIAALIALAVIADRLALAAEDRVWIFYRRRRAQSGGATATVFGPLFDLVQPSRQIVIEQQQQQHEKLLRRIGLRVERAGPPPRPADGMTAGRAAAAVGSNACTHLTTCWPG